MWFSGGLQYGSNFHYPLPCRIDYRRRYGPGFAF